MLDVRLQLVCTSKPGTLSRVIREINLVGLQYQHHQIEKSGDRVCFTIHASGELNCSLATLEQLFGAFPEVIGTPSLQATRDGKAITEIRTQVPETRISASDPLTPAIRLAAEKRLSDILGPVASVIVAAVAGNCRNAGELYSRLADELDDEERIQFLTVIEN